MAAVILMGGGGASDGKPAAAPTVSAAASVSVDPQAAEKAAVLATYAGMGTAEVRSYACPRPRHRYTRTSAASPGGRYPVTATTTWDVAWEGAV
ncbi:hypothetical protein [Streptomyces sp. NPDC056540]|uniref:hypothetical protein n=1 Tax=Streptomyces sp. NPDC056540 TaxID=3345859 RepID=UPI0036C22C3D